MSEKLIVPDSVREALVAFRSKSLEGGRHFLVLAYEGKNQLKVAGTGPGFADEAVALFEEGECRYAYLRTDHQVEQAKTTKYALLDWTPDSIAPMRKALLSTHKAQVRELLQPISASIQASKKGELSTELVLEKIGEASGTKSNVTNKAAFNAPAVDISRSAAAKESDYLPASAKNAAALNLKDESAIRAAFKAVRSDADETQWALLGFTDDHYTQLELKKSGSGGPGELAAALDPSQPSYALFRTREQIDATSAVRFSFLRVVPTTLPPSKKANIGVLGGAIQDLFKPYSFDFDFSDVKDFSEEVVHDKISGLSGMKNMSISAAASSGSKVAHPLGALSSPSGSGAGPAAFVAQPSGSITLDEPLQAALRAVRTDAKQGAEQTHWLVAGKVAGQDALTLLAQGNSSSVDELKKHFQPNDINFALLRVSDRIDNSDTVKFVLIKSQPEATPAMKKSAVSTKQGLYQQAFHPFSTEIFISSPDEISQESVTDKVASSSGSKSKVVAK